MKYFKFIIIVTLLINNAFGQAQDFNEKEESDTVNSNKKVYYNIHATISHPDAHLWGGIQVGLKLTNLIELLGIADIMIGDQPFCDLLLQGNIAYIINLNKMSSAFFTGEIGSHRCNEAGVTTPMVNCGTGIQLLRKPTIRLEYKAHIKFNRKGYGNITHDNLHVLSVGISMF